MKTAVVTGASSGVGTEVAKRLVARGWKVYGLARSPVPLEMVRAELGAGFVPVPTDVRQASSVAAAFATIAASLTGKDGPRIDLLVNNAAVFKMAEFATCSLSDIDNLIDTNLKGTLYCTHAALALLGPGSRIVNIGSVAGTHGIANQAIYCASKFGVDGFAEALNQELIGRGISITTICPGGIDTPLWQDASNPYPGDLSKILDPGDVAGLVEYVAGLPQRVVLKKAVLFPSNEWH